MMLDVYIIIRLHSIKC